jgi:lipoteichoic acid synthase
MKSRISSFASRQRLAAIAFSVLFGTSLAFSLTSQLLVDHLNSWLDYSVAVTILTVLGAGAASFILQRGSQRLIVVPVGTRRILLLLSVGLGTLFANVRTNQGDSLVWVKAVGDFVGPQVVVGEHESWNKRYSAFAAHATINREPEWMWRALADLPKAVTVFGGTVTLLLTQPEWSVFDKEGRLNQGGDGVGVRWLVERDGETKFVSQVNLNLHARSSERTWQTTKVQVPAGAQRLVLEVLPGGPGNNDSFDHVLISVKRVRSSVEATGDLADSVVIVLLLYLLGLLVNFWLRSLKSALPAALFIRILGCSALLLLFLVLIRVAALEAPSVTSLSTISSILLAASIDFFYVAALTGAFLLFVCGFRHNLKVQYLIFSLYGITALISLSVGIVNTEVSRLLGAPLNYQWLYYSDFLGGQTARDSIFAYVFVSWKLLLLVIGGNVVYLVLLFAMRPRSGTRIEQKAALSVSVLATTYFGLGLCSFAWSNATVEQDPKLANPVVSFVKSILTSEKGPKLFTMQTSVSPEEFQGLTRRRLEVSARRNAPISPVKNVVFFVLESVAAEYVYQKVSSFEVTPQIKKNQRESATFMNIYAHVPATNKSLVSMLCSVYPWISYKSLTEEYPGIMLESISAELKKRGYRTGFFSAGDFRFQRGDEFLMHQQFDVVLNYKNLPCHGREFRNSTREWPFQDSYDDECMVKVFTDWVDQSVNRQFFAVLWPVQTHHPYSLVEKEANLHAASAEFNRYLNALRRSDWLLGKLLDWLEYRELLDSTLVVVVGDHGEAFGQHGQWFHASHIYEENVHVPLMLINRRLFKGEEYESIGGLIDLGPTVMDILNIPLPTSWQGHSLFSENRSQRTFFFAPFSRYLFGLRDHNLKIILDTTANKYEIYDLQTDPKELKNLAKEMPRVVQKAEQWLAAWVQYQNKFYGQLFEARRKNS